MYGHRHHVSATVVSHPSQHQKSAKINEIVEKKVRSLEEEAKINEKQQQQHRIFAPMIKNEFVSNACTLLWYGVHSEHVNMYACNAQSESEKTCRTLV